MAVVGTGVINITPKFPGLSSAIKSELGKYDGTNSGSKAGDQYSSGFKKSAGSGLVKSGAVIGAFSSITTKAMSAIAGSMDSAVSRFDTLNNYPTVMQNLGYSAQEADESLAKMDEHLQGLPTAINDMASTVQGITAVTGDLSVATDASLALNDMLLASGSSTQLTSAAMEQFRQILAKGKPDMQDWKSLTSAMPGQMNQLAEAMLGAGATSNDLYTALGGGGAKAKVSTEQLLKAMVKLDTEGSGSMSSFTDQAKTATGGVATSMANVQTAVTRGVANIMDTIGKDTISGGFSGLTDLINGAFKAVNSGVGAAMPAIKGIAAAVKELAPAIATGAAAFAVLGKNGLNVGSKLVGVASAVGSAWSSAMSANSFAQLTNGQQRFVSAMDVSRQGVGKLGSAIEGLLTPTNLMTAGLTIAAGTAVMLYTKFSEYTHNIEEADRATHSLSDAVSDSISLDTFSQSLSATADNASSSAMSIQELREAVNDHADAINEANQAASEQLAPLQSAQEIINQYAGQTDLTAEAQGRLNYALEQVNDQFGLSLTAADVAKNKYKDQDGEVQNLTDSINDLVNAKKAEIKMDALSSSYEETMKAQTEAAQTYTDMLNNQGDKVDELTQKIMADSAGQVDAATARQMAEEEYSRQLDEAKGKVDEYGQNLKQLEDNMSDVGQATSDSATKVDKWYSALDSGTQAIMESLSSEHGGISAFKEQLEDLGVKTKSLKTLSSDELQAIVQNWDGSTQSLAAILSSYGVKMDESKAKTAKAVEGIRDGLKALPESWQSAMNGIDADQLAKSMESAGVSIEELESMGSANFAELASSCNGNTDLIISAIDELNSLGIDSKSAKITATGNVADGKAKLKIDGTEYSIKKLKNGKVSITATGNVTDGSAKQSTDRFKSSVSSVTKKKWETTVSASGNVVNGSARTNLVDFLKSIGSLRKSYTSSVNVNQTVTKKTVNLGTSNVLSSGKKKSKDAKGGIRMHADGAIVDARGSGYPLDYVGEDGAEAIVPLTNKRYSAPFAKTIAEQMQQLGGAAGTVINVSLNYSAGDDANQMARDIARALRRVTA